jgi:hypothetical protein
VLQAFPLQAHWGGGTTPAFSGWLVIYSSCEEVPLSHYLELRAPHLFATCLFYFIFIQLLVYYSFFSLFSMDGDQSVQGAMLIYLVPLSSPGGLHFPSSLGAGIWQHGSPSGFSV